MHSMELGTLRNVERTFRGLCDGLDPDAVPLVEVAPMFRELERIARLAAGAKLRLLRKLDDAGTARASGARDSAEFVAEAAGTSVGAARDAIATSKRLAEQRDTDAALRRGELSEEQAKAVSDATAADPDAEQQLLNAAKTQSVRELKRRCAETKANAHPDDAARREAIRRNRTCRTWTDREGGWNLSMRHLPEVGAEIEALLAPYAHARFEAGRKAGQHESRDAYRADGMLDLARASVHGGGPRPKGARRADTKVFVHIDLDTLQRGHTVPGSTCRIDGVGPVDVAFVRSLLGEAFVVALVEDAVDVRSIVHLGRQVTAHQRSALEARGYQCEVPGCGVTWGLEIEHVRDYALTGVTTLDDLAWNCHHHHEQKTHHGYRLTGTPGNRIWTAPDGSTRLDQPSGVRTSHPPPCDRRISQRPSQLCSP